VKYRTCAVSVLWDLNYDLFYKYRLKHFSSRIHMPKFFDAEFVVTSETDEKIMEWFAKEDVYVVKTKKTEMTLSVDNYKYFLTKLKLFDDEIMDSCEVLIYSDADIYFINKGFDGILEACPLDMDICMTSQSRQFCSGLTCCPYSPVLVANSGVMVLRNPRVVQKALLETIANSKEEFRRDQHLFGHIICDLNVMKFHVLPDKFNANYNWDSLDAPGVIHYTAGPDILNPQMIPLTHPAYDTHEMFQQFRNYSFKVDPCYSQADRCEGVECSRASSGICVHTELAEIAPYINPMKDKLGFDMMTCSMRSFPIHFFRIFRDCGLTCDIMPLVEEKCFSSASFSIYYCGQFWTMWVHTTFVEKSFVVPTLAKMLKCCVGPFQQFLCFFAVTLISTFYFLRVFFFPSLMIALIVVWYFKTITPQKLKSERFEE